MSNSVKIQVHFSPMEGKFNLSVCSFTLSKERQSYQYLAFYLGLLFHWIPALLFLPKLGFWITGHFLETLESVRRKLPERKNLRPCEDSWRNESRSWVFYFLFIPKTKAHLLSWLSRMLISITKRNDEKYIMKPSILSIQISQQTTTLRWLSLKEHSFF